MKQTIEGSELIQRCADCGYCIFEQFLSRYQKRVEVLLESVPENHVHSKTIEEICDKDKDCDMKKAAKYAFVEDILPAQFSAVTILKLDLSRGGQREVDFDEALTIWIKYRDFGRGKRESYEDRFKESWAKGLRNGSQILTPKFIYEMIVSKDYEIKLSFLDKLFEEHKERDNRGIRL